MPCHSTIATNHLWNVSLSKVGVDYNDRVLPQGSTSHVTNSTDALKLCKMKYGMG